MLNLFMFDEFSVCHSLSQSATGVFDCLYQLFNIFTYDMFSVCHSVSQSVTGIVLFIFWLITQEHRFLKKLYKTQNMCHAF